MVEAGSQGPFSWENGNEILLSTLSELGLPRRLQNKLASRGHTLVGQLIQYRVSDLLSLSEMGFKTLTDTTRVLERHGLKLGSKLEWNDAEALKARQKLSRLPVGLSQSAGSACPKRFLDATLSEAGLPQRLINYMPLYGCNSVRQLLNWTEDELLRLPNLGATSVADAVALLSTYGLSLGSLDRTAADAPESEDSETGDDEPTERPEQAVELAVVDAAVPEEILLATLSELGMPQRFLTYLPAQGCGLIGQLIQRTESELLRLPNMGWTSLRQARSTLDKYGLAFGLSVPGWNDSEAWERRRALGDGIKRMLFDLDQSKTETSASTSIESEAKLIFESVESQRNVEMLLSLYGFDGSPPKTLETVGQVYRLTRERVRQIESRAKKRLNLRWLPTPHTQKGVEVLKQVQPASASRMTRALLEQGVAVSPIHPEAVTYFAGFVGIDCDVRRSLVGDDELFCTRVGEELVRGCARELRKSTSSMGCTSLERLAVVLGLPLKESTVVRTILEALSEVVWLGRGRDWAASNRPTRNRVLNLSEKVFSVTDQITLSELRRCLARSTRLLSVPAPDALADLLQIGGLATRREDILTRMKDKSPQSLSAIEQIFYEGFEECGNPAGREELETFCVDRKGVHPTSFALYLSNSPIITRLGVGVYALAGAHIPPGSVEAIQNRNRQTSVVSDYGWTVDGKLWCAFTVDRHLIRTASRYIPAYVARFVEGRWSCRVAGGLPAGDIRIENGFARDLHIGLRLAGAENGDVARLSFDLPSKVVELRAGGPELLDSAYSPDDSEEPEDSLDDFN